MTKTMISHNKFITAPLNKFFLKKLSVPIAPYQSKLFDPLVGISIRTSPRNMGDDLHKHIIRQLRKKILEKRDLGCLLQSDIQTDGFWKVIKICRGGHGDTGLVWCVFAVEPGAAATQGRTERVGRSAVMSYSSNSNAVVHTRQLCAQTPEVSMISSNLQLTIVAIADYSKSMIPNCYYKH